MIRRADECKFTVREQMRGGPGSIGQTEFVFKEEMYDKARLFGKLLLKPGCGIGFHNHDGESELFYIMKGTAIYNDNGTEVEVSAGDVTICPDGEGHGVENRSDEDVEIIAVIILK